LAPLELDEDELLPTTTLPDELDPPELDELELLLEPELELEELLVELTAAAEFSLTLVESRLLPPQPDAVATTSSARAMSFIAELLDDLQRRCPAR
jgi:hypothetical protein